MGVTHDLSYTTSGLSGPHRLTSIPDLLSIFITCGSLGVRAGVCVRARACRCEGLRIFILMYVYIYLYMFVRIKGRSLYLSAIINNKQLLYILNSTIRAIENPEKHL